MHLNLRRLREEVHIPDFFFRVKKKKTETLKLIDNISIVSLV